MLIISANNDYINSYQQDKWYIITKFYNHAEFIIARDELKSIHSYIVQLLCELALRMHVAGKIKQSFCSDSFIVMLSEILQKRD